MNILQICLRRSAMKKLMQHKSFIYHGESLECNMKSIRADLSELIDVSEDVVFYQEDVSMYESDQLTVEHWNDVRNNFLFNPTNAFKIIVFNNADKLSIVIQNKLLKPIEEADAKVKIIFNTTRPLIETIASRSITFKIISGSISKFPRSEKELMEFFEVTDSNIDTVRRPIIGLYKGIKENHSLIKLSGLIKEKSDALSFFADKMQEIAKLIILYETESGLITNRSLIARTYLEKVSNEGNLYLMMLELEAKRGEL